LSSKDVQFFLRAFIISEIAAVDMVTPPTASKEQEENGGKLGYGDCDICSIMLKELDG
jgi:hypothetical protein